MRVIIRHFYNISAFIGGICVIFAVVFWQELSLLQRLALLNFAVINFHFFEEFGFPGGFPAFANTLFACKHSPAPDRYPLNQLSACLTNWGTAIVLYFPPIFFPDVIWFGLAPILFGGVAQLIMHGLYNNLLLKRCYNAGLISTLFGHFPIAIVYINYIVMNDMATIWDWIIGIAIMVIWYVVIVRGIFLKGFGDINSPYPFEKVEMERFKRSK